MKKLRQFIGAILCLGILLSLIPFSVSAAEPTNLTAKAAICMDYDTGEILFAKDIDTMRCPASMTKIMTAYLVYEEMAKGTFTKESKFQISKHAKQISYNNDYPIPVALYDNEITVDQALQNILIPSASATCIVAAENISGSEEAFVVRMNETAARLGMKAEFKNSHGAIAHYTTCRSIAILIRDFINKYPDVLNYTSMTETTYGGEVWKNTNKLLTSYYYEGCDGFKTGTIDEAGYCLAATATRNGHRIISVVMGAKGDSSRHTESIQVLDYGFSILAERDAVAEKVTPALTTATDRPLRVGAEVLVELTLEGLPSAYQTKIALSADGKTLAEKSLKVEPNKPISLPIYLDESYEGTNRITVNAEIVLNGNIHLKASSVLPISDLPCSTYRDTAYHWAEDYIEKATENGWIVGYGNRTFLPEKNVTRAELVTILARILKIDAVDTSENFADTENHWAKDVINSMSAAGYINGYKGNFKPDQPITRQDACTILQRIYEFSVTEEATYTDAESISDYALEAVNALTGTGILEGYSDGSFRPLDNLTRAECVTLLSRIANEE